MTEIQSGAAFNEQLNWDSIDWSKVRREVKRTQVRIAKAVQENRYGKAKALQHLLSRSFYAKLLGVKKVTENKGAKTPGVDGILWKSPKQKLNAALQLKKRGYQTRPLRRIYIPKKNGKRRPLSIPTMKCRAMQALYLLGLEPISESSADPNSYGFRPKRSTKDAIEQCFNLLARTNSAQWILEGDIKSCFDEIDHEWLLNNIPMDKGILRKWLSAGYIEKNSLFTTERGTPQGGIISPCLLVLTLRGLEAYLKEIWPVKNPKRINIVVYADDFIVTCNSRDVLENDVRPMIREFLRERGLRLSEEKTRITNIQSGFDFLGFNIRKYGNKLLIKPEKKKVIDFIKSLGEVIKANKTAPTAALIRQLNPKIRGFANYYNSVVSSKTFNYIDSEIFWKIWRWCKRRHPKKNRKWIKRKYFKSYLRNNWRFCSGDPIKNDKATMLIKAISIHIRRHIKIKAKANPFNPKYDEYFEKRDSRRRRTKEIGLKKA